MRQKLRCVRIWSPAQCQELLGDVKALICNQRVHLHCLVVAWAFRYHESCKEFGHEAEPFVLRILLGSICCFVTAFAPLGTETRVHCVTVLLTLWFCRSGHRWWFLVCLLKCLWYTVIIKEYDTWYILRQIRSYYLYYIMLTYMINLMPFVGIAHSHELFTQNNPIHCASFKINSDL